MSHKLAHDIQIKKAEFKVDTTLSSLSNFKGLILKSSEIKDFAILKDKHVALIGFDHHQLVALNKALPYASFVKLFCENPAWVLKYHQSIFSMFSPLSSERVNRLRQNSQKTGFFQLDRQDPAASYALKKAQLNLKKIKNDWLARQLTPHHLSDQHTFIFNDDFIDNVQNPRVKVITWPIVQILEQGVLSMEGIHHLVDVIITTD